MRTPSLLGLALVAACGTASAADTNLVRNGGFEKGLDGWTTDDSSGTLDVAADTKTRDAGKASLRISKPAAKGMSADRVRANLTQVRAGAKLDVSVRVKGSDVQNAWIKVFAFDASGESVLEDCDVARVSGTFEWKDVAGVIDVPASAVRAEIRICMFLGGELWVDEVRVVESAAAPPAAKAAPLPDATRRWLDANAVKIATLAPDAPFADLEPLRAILADARIVQLGENTHGDGACFEAKARLVRFLHEEMGFDVLAFESGLWECDRANEALRKGDAEGAMTSSVFPIWHTAPVRGLFRYLADRAKSDRPMTLAGFDCRRSGGTANRFLDEIESVVAGADVAPLRALEKAMWEQGDEYAPAAADVKAADAAWTALRAAFDAKRDAIVAKRGAAEAEFLSRSIDNWRENEQFERSKRDRSLGTWGSGNLRDARMAANLRWLADVRHAGRKIVTWGATFHLARALDTIEVSGRPKMYAGCANMGSLIHDAYGPKVYTIGFAAHGGRAGTRFAAKPSALDVPREGSVEDLLHRYGAPRLFVNLRADGPLRARTRLAVLGYDRGMQAEWAGIIDGLVFLDEMTPAR